MSSPLSLWTKGAGFLVSVSLVTAGLVSQAFSSVTVQFGLSAPNVVTSAVSGAGTVTEDFSQSPLPASSSLGTYSTSGTVSIAADDVWGGSGSNYLAIGVGSSFTVALTSPAKYVGFWWGAGDDGNQVELYGGSPETLLATFTTSSLTQELSGATVTDVDGTSQNSADYSRSGAASQPFAYVNLQLSDSDLTFTRVVFKHAGGSGGFELDNVTVSPTWGAATAATQQQVAATQAATVPDAPTITYVASDNGKLEVGFTAPASDGGDAITNYKYSTDGTNYIELNPASTSSPITIDALTNGTTYPVSLKAVNSIGDSVASAAVSGTPTAPPLIPNTGFETGTTADWVSSTNSLHSYPSTLSSSGGGAGRISGEVSFNASAHSHPCSGSIPA